MELTVTTRKIENEKEIATILDDLKFLLSSINQRLSMFSLNRYLRTPLSEINLNKLTTKEWFYQSRLILSENGLYCTMDEYDTFILFLKDYALLHYEIEFLDNESTFADYQYVDFLVYITFKKELDKMLETYCNYFDFNIERMTLHYFVITTFDMYFGDELPLQHFINMILDLYAKEYIQENINRLERGEHEIYDLAPFNY